MEPGRDRRRRRRSSSSRATFAAQLALVALRGAAAAAHLVLRLEHLLHVVDFVLRLEFGRAGRLPVDQFGVVAGVEVLDHERAPRREQHHRDGSQDEVTRPRIRRSRQATPV